MNAKTTEAQLSHWWKLALMMDDDACRMIDKATIQALVDDATSLHALHRQLDAVKAERDAAVAIVAKLPKTADGVPIVIGGSVFAFETYVRVYRICEREDGELWASFGTAKKSDGWGPISDIYSTREAASAALTASQTGEEVKP